MDVPMTKMELEIEIVEKCWWAVRGAVSALGSRSAERRIWYKALASRSGC